MRTLRADADAGNETSMVILIYTGYRISERRRNGWIKWTWRRAS